MSAATESVLLIGASGYVGSAITERLPKQFKVRVVTNDVRVASDGSVPDFHCSHEVIPDSEIARYAVVLFFGGCSSVQQAELDPLVALEQNATSVVHLARRLAPDQRFVYASSASVYSSPAIAVGDAPCLLSTENSPTARPMNAYDASRAACDLLMSMLPRATTGLRMGTVCGYSAGLRPELVFNSMVSRASMGLPIEVRNPNAWRGLLHIEDLVSLIASLLRANGPLPRIVNVVSQNIRIGELATRMARLFKVDVRELPESKTYSFAMDGGLARSYFTPVEKSLEEHAKEFASVLRAR